MYEPRPIDTTGIELPRELAELVELMARNNHELWASRRMAEGWTVGPRRDDEKRQHPCLVPYEELPESEKEYDRVLVVQIVKTILSMGFGITRE